MFNQQSSKSVAIAARLNGKVPQEADAIAILNHFESKGYSKRTILANALLSLAEREGLSEFEAKSNDAIMPMMRELLSMVRELSRGGTPVTPLYNAIAEQDDLDDDDSAFMANLASAYQNR